MAVGQDPVIADALEAAGQDVEEKASNKLTGIQGHGLLQTVSVVVLAGEGDLGVLDANEAMIGNGYAVGVARQVIEDGIGACKRRFGMNDPFPASTVVEKRCKRVGFGQCFDRTMESQLALLEGVVQGLEEAAAKETGQDPDGQEEAVLAGYPALVVRGQSAAGDDTVQMRMV